MSEPEQSLKSTPFGVELFWHWQVEERPASRSSIMLSRPRRTWTIALACPLVAALAGPAAGQSPAPGTSAFPPVEPPPLAAAVIPPVELPPPASDGFRARVPVAGTVVSAQPPTAPAQTPTSPPQTPSDAGMSSKPPAFTLPSATAKDAGAPAAANTNDASPFAGFPDVQDAFSRLLPGNFKDTKYKWYGFVRMDAIYDTRPMGSTDDFVTSSIPVPQGKGQNFVMTPRYTRLGFDTLTPLKDCYDWEVKTRIEMDFFNGNTSGAFGSFPLRLRFAWIDVGPFLVGQAASLFMDYDVYPNVLDYQGPPGMVLVRQPIAAYRYQVADNLRVA